MSLHLPRKDLNRKTSLIPNVLLKQPWLVAVYKVPKVPGEFVPYAITGYSFAAAELSLSMLLKVQSVTSGLYRIHHYYGCVSTQL
jgi:hypothetical protein